MTAPFGCLVTFNDAHAFAAWETEPEFMFRAMMKNPHLVFW